MAVPMTSEMIARQTCTIRKPVGLLPFQALGSLLMFLINVTQMIQDQMANAIRSHEARRESRMSTRLPRHSFTSYRR